MQHINRIFWGTLCVFLISTTAAMAFGEIRYADRLLNLRNDRSSEATWIGLLFPGQKVRVAFLEHGWCAVFEPDETRNIEDAAVGYANIRYLLETPVQAKPVRWGKLVYATRELAIRDNTSSHGKEVGRLAANQRVRIDFPEDGWVRVFALDATIRSKRNSIGFSDASLLRDVEENPRIAQKMANEVVASTSAGSPAGKEKKTVAQTPGSTWGKLLTLKHTVNLRKGRSSNSRYVRVLSAGDTVRVDFLEDGWYAVFLENEPLRKEQRALGYAPQSLLEGESGSNVDATKGASVSVSPELVRDRRQTLVIDKSRFSGAKRPDPIPDKTVHGYHYKLLGKTETKKFGESWLTVRIFLSTTTLPNTQAMVDFAKTIWEKHKQINKNLAVLIYLPGMDTDDLSYGVILFNDTEVLEVWQRKTTLFGTKFM